MTSRYLRRVRRSQKLPPGSLVYEGPPRDHAVTIRQVVYDPERHLESRVDPAEIGTLAWDPGSVGWVSFDGVHEPVLIEQVVERFRLPSLIGEDLIGVGQRPGIEAFDEGALITARLLEWGPEQATITGSQLSLVLMPGGVLSFEEVPGDLFEGVRSRIQQGLGRIRSAGPDYLLYALLDALVGGYSAVVVELSDRIEALEEIALDELPDEFPTMIRALRKEAILLRRAMWPLRDVFTALLRPAAHLIQDENVPYVRDAHDHLVQLIEATDAMKEALASLTEYHVSAVNQKANEIMMVLTLVATIFIPLTFLAGIYGMNFEYMPELAFPWAYPALIGLMLGVGLGMVALFRRRGWL